MPLAHALGVKLNRAKGNSDISIFLHLPKFFPPILEHSSESF